jgi:hypothetical protein
MPHKQMWRKRGRSFNKQELMMIDYAPLLIRIEQNTKKLSDKCLNKKYEGYSNDIAQIHADLTHLAMWMVAQETKDILDGVYRSE